MEEIETQLSLSKNTPFDPNIRKYFLKHSENALAKEIIKMSNKGIHIDKPLIRSIETKHYQTSCELAERASYNIFSNNRFKIYEDLQKEKFTQEFIDFAQEINKRFSFGIFLMIHKVKWQNI